MLKEEGVFYDDIKVYIYRDTYFGQIKFTYHTANAWLDDKLIISQQKNYQNLVKLHAYLECIEDKDLEFVTSDTNGNIFYTNFDNAYGSKSNFNALYTISDENLLDSMYQKWFDAVT
jgi:hypothetical protein